MKQLTEYDDATMKDTQQYKYGLFMHGIKMEILAKCIFEWKSIHA